MNTSHPMQPIVQDAKCVARFKANAIVRYLLDHGGIDMNRLATLEFSDEDRQQFAQLTGHSVSDYGNLPYASEASVREADAQAGKVYAEANGINVPNRGSQEGDVDRVLGFAEQFLDNWAEDARQHGDAPDRTEVSLARDAYNRVMVVLRRAAATRDALRGVMPMAERYADQVKYNASMLGKRPVVPGQEGRAVIFRQIARTCGEQVAAARLALEMLG